jgi:xylulokinase
MLSAGGSLQWLRNTLYATQVKKMRDPGELYARMIDMAADVPAGAEDLFFLPYLTGERCPHADPNARAAFIGLTPRHGVPEMIRAVIEGITFGMREQTTIFRAMGIAIEQVRASGGGARSAFWRQMQADMYHSPVVTINVSEGAALGAAILAAVGVGDYASVPEATKAIIRVKEKHHPHGKAADTYDRQYAKYAQLYPALRATFAALHGG